MRDDYISKAYKYNTVFRSWYAIRFLIFVIGGFVFLILLQTKNSVADFFCLRYYDLHRDHIVGDADTKIEKDLLADLEYCDSGVRIFLWVMYFPLALFQYHALKTLQHYGTHVLNREMKDILLGAEQDV